MLIRRLCLVAALASALTLPPQPLAGPPPRTRVVEWRPSPDRVFDPTAEPETFHSPFPLEALGVLWTGSVPRLRVRTQLPDGGWTPWRPVETADHRRARTGELASALVSLHGARGVQLQGDRGDEDSLPTSMRVIGIDSAAETAGELRAAQVPPLPSPFPVGPPPPMVATPTRTATPAPSPPSAPRIITRAEWGADPQYLQWTPSHVPVRKFAIHHTATSDGGANPAAAIRAIYYYHAVTLGWGDIGYNYLIDRAGNIYEGRAGGPNAVGAHVEVANEGVDGIALLGTYQDAAPSEAMTTALVSLLAWRSRSAGVDPQGNGPLAGRTVPNILGHRDVMSTDCPGDAAYALLPSIRLQVAAALAPRPPSPTIRVVSTRVSPAAVSVGGDVKVEVTVTNAGTDPIASQGPEPGTSYAEGESFRSIGQPEVPGRIRIGVDLDGGTDPDHRFRWGLGGDLAPGASRTVVGSITFDRPGTRTLSVGVVQEGVAWLLDGLGRTTVVVRPGIAAAYRATSAPATELHFPLVMLRYHGWTTRIHITNTTDRPGVGSLAVLGADGRALSRTPLLLPPRGTVRKTMDFGDDGMGGVAAAVVVADVPLAGVAFHERAEGDWMAVEPVTGGAPRIYVPLAARRYRGLSSGVQVQNLGETRATVWITYLDSAGATWTDSALVPPMGFATFFAPGHATLPDGFVGSAIVESDGGQPLAGQVNLVTAGGAAMAYVAEDSPGPEVLAPLLFRNRGGWRTGLQVQNTGGPVAAIVARYTPVNRPGGPWEREATIPGALAGTLYLPADPLLPDDLVAAAQVRSVRGEPLAVIANSVNDRRRVGTAVGAVGSIGPRLYVPLVSTGVDGQVTGVQVQNVAPQPAPVVVAVFDDRGALLTQFEETIPANGARTLYAPAAPGLGAGSSGSMVVVGRPDARLAAVVTEAR